MVARKSVFALRTELRQFVSAHPEGWGHKEFVDLMETLRGKGFSVTDEAAIGSEVERERLALVLGKIKNVGPQRIKVLIDRYDTVWSLRGADPTELAASTRIPLAVAEQIKQAV